MVSALGSRSNGPESSPGRGTVLCSWGRHFLLSKCLSPPRCKSAGGNDGQESHPRGGVEILLVASCYGNRDKLQPDGPLGSYMQTYVLPCFPPFQFLNFSPPRLGMCFLPLETRCLVQSTSCFPGQSLQG